MGIRDKRVLSIIKEMLKVGYIDNELHSITKDGTAQGSTLSPLLANCYLNSFDWTVGRMYQTPIQKCKCIRNDRRRLITHGVKPKYLVRYADDWIILTTEEKEAKRILCYLRKYYRYRLKLELSEEKTFITNLTVKPAKFLGFIVKAAAPRGAPTNGKAKLVGKAYPNIKKVKTQVQNINNEVRKLKNIMSDTLRIFKIKKINSMIMGVAEYWKTAICSDTFSYIDENVHRCAYATFKKMYGKKIKNHYVPLKKLINNQNRHNGYETKTFAVKANGNFIGITKAFITHSNWERCPFNSKMTPYSEEGRELYIKRNGKTKKLALNRPNIMEAIESTMIADRQVYNFEYFMNRAYAYNRDRGKCRVCSNPLKEHGRHCHHVRNSLPINEINKVQNLAWICVKCHEYIHGMDVPIKTTKEIKIKIKIKAYKEKLKVVRT